MLCTCENFALNLERLRRQHQLQKFPVKRPVEILQWIHTALSRAKSKKVFAIVNMDR